MPALLLAVAAFIGSICLGQKLKKPVMSSAGVRQTMVYDEKLTRNGETLYVHRVYDRCPRGFLRVETFDGKRAECR